VAQVHYTERYKTQHNLVLSRKQPLVVEHQHQQADRGNKTQKKDEYFPSPAAGSAAPV
jgi:hypothetical protein